MIEVLSLLLFAGLVATFLVLLPAAFEKLSSPDFCNRYFSHLSSKTLHSYGK